MDFSKIKEKVEKILKNGDKKKTREYLISIVVIGMLLILAANFIFGGNTKAEKISPNKDDTYVEAAKISSADKSDDMSKRLEVILGKISGAGNVSVLITYSTSKETVPAYDTKKNTSDTQQKDSTGGTSNSKTNNSESQVVFEESSGSKKPVVIKEISPEIKGVLIVSDGAADAVVKENITRAAQVVLDVPVHKIQVAPRGK